MTEIERLRAEIEGLRIVCATIYQEAPAQVTKGMKKAARDALKAYSGPLTEDQRAVMGRLVLLTTTTLSADDPRLPKDPQAAPQAAEAEASVTTP
jgi:hypothetical protein